MGDKKRETDNRKFAVVAQHTDRQRPGLERDAWDILREHRRRGVCFSSP